MFDDEGRPVRGREGRAGVHAAPFPSMPVGFWNDPDGTRYHAAYFEQFPGVWCHGDYVELTEHGGFIIYGRSDAVLNPGGVRIGTAEIYRQVEQLPRWWRASSSARSGRATCASCCSCACATAYAGRGAGRHASGRQIRANTTPRHVPAKVVQVARHPAHQERQDRRAGGAQRGARPAGEEQGGAGQPRGAGSVS